MDWLGLAKLIEEQSHKKRGKLPFDYPFCQKLISLGIQSKINPDIEVVFEQINRFDVIKLSFLNIPKSAEAGQLIVRAFTACTNRFSSAKPLVTDFLKWYTAGNEQDQKAIHFGFEFCKGRVKKAKVYIPFVISNQLSYRKYFNSVPEVLNVVRISGTYSVVAFDLNSSGQKKDKMYIEIRPSDSNLILSRFKKMAPSLWRKVVSYNGIVEGHIRGNPLVRLMGFQFKGKNFRSSVKFYWSYKRGAVRQIPSFCNGLSGMHKSWSYKITKLIKKHGWYVGVICYGPEKLEICVR